MKSSALLYFLAVLLTANIFSCTEKQGGTKTILVVIAHPDDETAFAPVLAKYARLGHTVYLVIGVDGRYGNKAENNNPDSVALVNKNQAICSCKQLGIKEPIFFDLISLDRKHGQKDGVRAAVESGSKFRDQLKETILDIKPDLIITYGPDGEYGHPEHIIVSGLVTELLLREKWVDTYPLYYFGWTKTLEQGNDGWVRYADDQYFTAIIDYTNEDEQKAFESLHCYQRMSKNERQEIIEIEMKRVNELYFRKFIVAQEKKKDFFYEE
jgi:LmbE family N-acetylglucosaminyl deacetylase